MSDWSRRRWFAHQRFKYFGCDIKKLKKSLMDYEVLCKKRIITIQTHTWLSNKIYMSFKYDSCSYWKLRLWRGFTKRFKLEESFSHFLFHLKLIFENIFLHIFVRVNMHANPADGEMQFLFIQTSPFCSYQFLWRNMKFPKMIMWNEQWRNYSTRTWDKFKNFLFVVFGEAKIYF